MESVRTRAAAVHASLPLNHQPSTINHQPSTINHQPSTINHQPSTINHQLFLRGLTPPGSPGDATLVAGFGRGG
jgi:hypothetical protein